MKWNWTKAALGFIGVVLLFVTTNINWGKDDWKGALESDAKGYYAYLPAIFIYHDLNFSFLEEVEKKYAQDHLYYEYRSNAHGVLINKYYCGVAVLQTPFFLLAHLITYLTQGDLDGYSKWYMLMISVISIVYHLIGLVFFAKLLREYRVSDQNVAIALFLTSFATHLFAYTIVEAGMSHVYSFALVSAFLFYAKRYFKQFKQRDLIRLTLVFGLIVLCRPINALIVLFLPFLLGGITPFLQGIKSWIRSWKHLLLSILIVSSIASVQLIIYKISTGHFLVYSYDQEGFNFLDPHLLKLLFSYKKGLFLYTPICLVGVLCVILQYKKSKEIFWSWLIAFTILSYVFSSWWMWFYGGSFSSRVFVEYLPLFILPIVLFLEQLVSRKKKRILIMLLAILTIVCQIQTYQYRYYEIHYSEMTKEKYWEVFLLRNRF